jgi:hypothetical protein
VRAALTNRRRRERDQAVGAEALPSSGSATHRPAITTQRNASSSPWLTAFQSTSRAVARLTRHLPLTDPERYFNCWFLGLDALQTLLENVDSSESFWRELKRTRHVTTGSLSWHHDYRWARSLDGALASAAERTGATMMFGGE